MNKHSLRFTLALGLMVLFSSCQKDVVSQFTPQSDPTLVFDPNRTDHGRDWFTSAETLKFVDPEGKSWIAPQDTITDGASIPDQALKLIGVERIGILETQSRLPQSFESHFRAALIHDAYCGTENEGVGENYQTATWRETHRMFFDACVAGGTNLKLAKTMFSAVWIFGPRWGDESALVDRAKPTLLQELFKVGKQWIEDEDPPCEMIEAWVAHCQDPLIKEGRIIMPDEMPQPVN